MWANIVVFNTFVCALRMFISLSHPNYETDGLVELRIEELIIID